MINRRYGFNEKTHDKERTLLVRLLWKFQDAYQDEAYNNSNPDRRADMMRRYMKMSILIRDVMETTDLSESFDEALYKEIYGDK